MSSMTAADSRVCCRGIGLAVANASLGSMCQVLRQFGILVEQVDESFRRLTHNFLDVKRKFVRHPRGVEYGVHALVDQRLARQHGAEPGGYFDRLVERPVQSPVVVLAQWPAAE